MEPTSSMDEGFLCEAVGSLVVVRLTRPMSERVLEECQLCMLETMQENRLKAVLYDLTEMQPASLNVLLCQRILSDHMRHLDLRRAIVVPNTPDRASPDSPSVSVTTNCSTTISRLPGGSCATRARFRAPTGAFA